LNLDYWVLLLYLTMNVSIVYHHYELNDDFEEDHFDVENVVVVVEIDDLIAMDDDRQDAVVEVVVVDPDRVDVVEVENEVEVAKVVVLDDDDWDGGDDDDDQCDEVKRVG
jgi:hypothetical protein